MDLSGVDVDCLSDIEILELCGDIVDTNPNEIFGLENVDINNSSDEKVQELYDDVMSSNNNYPAVPVTADLTDEQILDNNYNTLDRDFSEILLLNGQNINFDNLTDDEILAIYDDEISENALIATNEKLYCVLSNLTYFYSSEYHSIDKERFINCYSNTYKKTCNGLGVVYGHDAGSETYWIPGVSDVYISSSYCTSYHKMKVSFTGSGAYETRTYTVEDWGTCTNICK